jgi:hypothetical protein
MTSLTHPVPARSLRAVPLVAKACLVARHGRTRAVRVARGRFEDFALLLVAVVVALVLRGWTRHQVDSALADAGWAVVAVGLYLPVVFVAGCLEGWRSLRGWVASHQPIVQGVVLGLTPTRGFEVSEARVLVHCEDGTWHEAPVHGDPLVCHWNIAFRSTGVYPPHGRHDATWQIKETPEDGWINVARDRFDYPARPGA